MPGRLGSTCRLQGCIRAGIIATLAERALCVDQREAPDAKPTVGERVGVEMEQLYGGAPVGLSRVYTSIHTYTLGRDFVERS